MCGTKLKESNIPIKVRASIKAYKPQGFVIGWDKCSQSCTMAYLSFDKIDYVTSSLATSVKLGDKLMHVIIS